MIIQIPLSVYTRINKNEQKMRTKGFKITSSPKVLLGVHQDKDDYNENLDERGTPLYSWCDLSVKTKEVMISN